MHGRNRPQRLAPVRDEDPRVMDTATGNAGRDGYTSLSRADRETGRRPPIGDRPTFGRYHGD